MVGDIFQGGSVLTFQQVKNKFGVSNGDFLKYMQVQNFILSKLRVFSGGLAISPVESLLVGNVQLKSFTKRLYGILCGFEEDNSEKVKGKWESDLGTIIKPEDCATLCNQPSSVLASNSAWERQFKILHRLYITPEVRHRMNPATSDLCTKCQSAVGSLFHCLWSCPHIQQFWITIAQQLDKIFKQPLHLGARTCALGLPDELPADLNTKLVHILLHCAPKCILLMWICDKAPTLNQWFYTVTSIVPFEAFSTALKDKPFTFDKIWDSFFDYLGPAKAQRMDSGLMDLAWRGTGD